MSRTKGDALYSRQLSAVMLTLLPIYVIAFDTSSGRASINSRCSLESHKTLVTRIRVTIQRENDTNATTCILQGRIPINTCSRAMPHELGSSREECG